MNPSLIINVAKITIEVLGLFVEVGNKLVSIFKRIGILKETRNVDELGDKILQSEADNIKVENEPDIETYLKKVDDYQIDPAKCECYSREKKIGAAFEILNNAMAEKYPNASHIEEFISEEVADERHREFYTAERIHSYLDKMNDKNIDMRDVGRYFDQKLDDLQMKKTIDGVLIDAEIAMGSSNETAVNVLDDEKEKRFT